MINSDIKEKLINMKLDGSLDSYSELLKVCDDTHSIKELKLQGKTIKDIVISKLGISKDLYKEFEDKNPNIQYIKSKCSADRIRGFKSKINFYKWYINQPRSCCYCGVSENILTMYFTNSKNQVSKRKRGKVLEIERILTDEENNNYSEENCSLACYICNNAKSDLIYYKDFKHLAKGIHNFWKIKFPEEKITFPETFYK